jgi:transcriptional regulator with GAF, ATPase, and Fis domain
MVLQCPKIRNVLKTAAAVARTDATVLIQGETEPGKNELPNIFMRQVEGQGH